MARFTSIPFNIVGGTYENRSKPVSTQRTVNMYQQVNPKVKTQVSLQSFPGQKLFKGVVGDVDRNTHNMAEVLYRVVDNTLYSVNTLGRHTSLGTVTGSNRCIFADDGDNLVIISDKVYVYTKSTDTFKENENVNLVNVLSVTIINNQFIYTTPDLSFMAQPGDPFDVSGLDAVGAESNPDKLVRDYVFNQTIYRFGIRTMEPWYNTDSGKPPIDRIDGQQISVGLGAISSLASTDRAIYWLGDDKCIYRISGGIYERISDDGISNSIEEMTTINDAFGYVFTLQGQDFYLITFPSENKTFVNNESLGKDGWFELRSFNDLAYSGTSLIQIYDKLIIANKGDLLTLELNEFTQNTDTMIRERITDEITPEDLGLDFDMILMSSLTLKVESGVGLITGQGENPRIRVELSTDGGRTYPHVQWVEIGQLGEHTQLVEIDMFATGRSLRFRLRMSDPVPLTIYGAKLKVKGIMH